MLIEVELALCRSATEESPGVEDWLRATLVATSVLWLDDACKLMLRLLRDMPATMH